MFSLMDEVVIADENREGFELFMGASDEGAGVLRAVVYGPAGAGKSTAAQARGRTRDLLSTKSISYAHVSELMSFLELGDVGERYLEQAGDVDVLLLDGIDPSLALDDVACKMCQLLMGARGESGRSTVLVADAQPEEVREWLGDACESYDFVEVGPLSGEGRLEFAQRMVLRYGDGEKSPVQLTEDALRFIAFDFADCAAEVRKALCYLMKSGVIAKGEIADSDQVREALGA